MKKKRTKWLIGMLLTILLYLAAGILLRGSGRVAFCYEDHDAEHEIWRPTVVGWIFLPSGLLYEELLVFNREPQMEAWNTNGQHTEE